MAKRKKEEALEEETPRSKSKYYDVLDVNGDLLNIYEDKKMAEEFAGKVKGRKVVPSPAGRTREDVMDAIIKKKEERLKKLEEGEQVLDKF